MAEKRDYYEVLGVEKGADKKDIKNPIKPKNLCFCVIPMLTLLKTFFIDYHKFIIIARQ